MASTYEPIATTTLGTAAATITFSSISSAFTDLRLVLSIPSTASAGSSVHFRLNGDSTNNYSLTRLYGDGTSAVSNRVAATSEWGTAISTSTTLPVMLTMDLMSYTNAKYKTALITTSTDANGSGRAQRIAGMYQTFSAIDSLTITCGSNMAIGTTATLYGILKA